MRRLSGQGLRVGVLKHTHHEVEYDHAGKDSWRYAQAAADQVLLTSPTRTAYFDYSTAEMSPEIAISRYFHDLDLVIIEGYKWSSLPKIEVFRGAVSERPMCVDDPNLLAIATPDELDDDVRQIDLDDPDAVVEFILGVVHL